MNSMDPQRDRWKLSHHLLIRTFVCICMGTIRSFDLQISSGVDSHLTVVLIKKLPLAVAFDFESTMNKTDSNKTACLCLIVKDPFRRYIDEWVDYHIMALGFNSIRLYDNTDNFVMKDWGIHKPYADQITRMHFLPNVTINVKEYKNGKTEVTKFQDAVYMDCVQSAIDEEIDWVAAFDEDEFLVLRNSSSILDFMDNHCQYPCGQMSFNSVPIGSVNRSRYVPVPVTRRFQHRAEPNPERDKWVKAIVNPAAVLQEQFWLHTFPLKKPWVWKDTSGRIISSGNLRWNMQTNLHRPLDEAVLYHFKDLSEEEYNFRHEVRGDVNGLNQTEEYRNQRIFDVFDDNLWQVLRKSVPTYQQFDNVQDMGQQGYLVDSV